MYTRNYRINSDQARVKTTPKIEIAPKEQGEASAEKYLPPIEVPESSEQPEKCEIIEPVTEETQKMPAKRRYRASRIVRCTGEPSEAKEEPCGISTEIPGGCCTGTCEPEKSCKEREKGGLHGFLSGLASDELLVLALAVMLLCQGGDDILVLALCFILL